MMVLLDHTNLFKHLHLGQTGVGIFFGLSGYLITGLLLDEQAKSGKLDLPRFYLRRMARLMPGAAVVVCTCSVAFLLLGAKREVLNGVFALSYTTNYAAIYFGHHLTGFGHFWSLAVEEHFYLFWPLALILFAKRGGVRTVAWGAFGLCGLVLAWRALLAHAGGYDLLLYIGTIERLDSMLYGAIAACLVRLGWRPHIGMLALGGALLLASVLSPIGKDGLMASMIQGLGGASVAVALDHSPCNWLRKALSWRPVVSVGLLSYSLYLWHLPVYQLVERVFGSTPSVKLLAITVSFGMAYAGYRCIEVPARHHLRRRIDERSSAAPQKTAEA